MPVCLSSCPFFLVSLLSFACFFFLLLTCESCTSAPAVMSVLLSIVSVCATVVCIFMLSSPILTVQAMVRAKSIGVMTITFFCAQYVNCCVWAMYGIQRLAVPVIVCNAVGILVATYCVLVFIATAQKEERAGSVLRSTTSYAIVLTAAATGGLCLFLMCFMIVLYVVAGPTTAATVNGLMAACASVFMLSSPLGAAKDIIRAKNAEPLQPHTIAFATLNSVLWSLYGFLSADVMIVVPNTLCTIACLFQVALIAYYGRRPVEAVILSVSPMDSPVA